MQSLWNEKEAQACADDPIQLRIYSSRLLGREPDLVLNGGGNTSLKTVVSNIFGDQENILYVKGSGQDLATLTAEGLAPVKLDILKRIAALKHISDTELMQLQRSAMTDAFAPDPSIEAVLHAIIPFRYVDHTHADALLAITNTSRGHELIREIYSRRVLVVPYVHPGFLLARRIYDMTADLKWDSVEGLILLKHGIFTFGDNAKDSYERMIGLVSIAEEYLKSHGYPDFLAQAPAQEDLLALSLIRRQVSRLKGRPLLARIESSSEACGFANLPDISSIAGRGPLAADHIIRTKSIPVVLGDDVNQSLEAFASEYKAYVDRNAGNLETCLDPAPGWAVWPHRGIIAFGPTVRATGIVADIARHTVKAIQCSQALGGWTPLSEQDCFSMEYWALQQAKLPRENNISDLQGKIALVTGAASGIGLACAKRLHARGAAVVGLDIDAAITQTFAEPGLQGICCDVTDIDVVRQAVETTVRRFGGLDILVSNAGVFSASCKIEALDDNDWNRSMDINLSSHQRLLKCCIAYLKHGLDATVIFIASKNVPAPGPGAASYSVAKAGLTQLARIAALELGCDGIRVNVVHPNAVYDTALWTPELLESRACQYECTVEEYKTKNCLKTEVSTHDVAELVCALAGPAFAKTTGAQIPIDGGNERVI